MTSHRFTALFPFGGLGAGALGFKRASARLFDATASFDVLGGIDFDDVASRDFVHLVDAPSLTADIARLAPAELRAFAGDKAPDVVFFSPPCLPGNVPVLTPDGAKRIESIRANDLVLTHAAEAIATQMLVALLQAALGTCALSANAVWVRPERGADA